MRRIFNFKAGETKKNQQLRWATNEARARSKKKAQLESEGGDSASKLGEWEKKRKATRARRRGKILDRMQENLNESIDKNLGTKNEPKKAPDAKSFKGEGASPKSKRPASMGKPHTNKGPGAGALVAGTAAGIGIIGGAAYVGHKLAKKAAEKRERNKRRRENEKERQRRS